jgi:hypothetical protein
MSAFPFCPAVDNAKNLLAAGIAGEGRQVPLSLEDKA